LEEIFRNKVFKILLSKGKITEDLVDMLMKWRHSGFNVFCGPRIQPGEKEVMENLARYIIRASFSQERMTYVPEKSKVIYHLSQELNILPPEFQRLVPEARSGEEPNGRPGTSCSPARKSCVGSSYWLAINTLNTAIRFRIQ